MAQIVFYKPLVADKKYTKFTFFPIVFRNLHSIIVGFRVLRWTHVGSTIEFHPVGATGGRSLPVYRRAARRDARPSWPVGALRVCGSG